LLDWAPVIVWACAIFFFSTDEFSSPNTSQILTPLLTWLFPGISPAAIEIVHEAVRKFGHWFEYFILSALLLRVLLNENSDQPAWRNFLWTLMLIFLYAAGDEFHQSFVPSRTASIYDVMIDLCGGICGTLGMVLYHARTESVRSLPQTVESPAPNTSLGRKKT
ncbi:MAG: VanZ family protein, partial [Candidatus Binatia bacterium]